MTDPKLPSRSMLPIPVRYQPSMETIGEREAKTIQGMIETMDRIQSIVAEDIGHGDLTALSMIEADARATFHMNARQDLSLAGIDVAAACFRRYDPGNLDNE